MFCQTPPNNDKIKSNQKKNKKKIKSNQKKNTTQSCKEMKAAVYAPGPAHAPTRRVRVWHAKVVGERQHTPPRRFAVGKVRLCAELIPVRPVHERGKHPESHRANKHGAGR
jgi:hypothetical protein